MKAAVSRLDFAPGTGEMEVTDIRTGHFVFPPEPGVTVSLSRLRKAIADAGYEVEDAWLEVTGESLPGGRLRVPGTGQVFELRGEAEAPPRAGEEADDRVTVFGRWEETEEGQAIAVERREVEG